MKRILSAAILLVPALGLCAPPLAWAGPGTVPATKSSAFHRLKVGFHVGQFDSGGSIILEVAPLSGGDKGVTGGLLIRPDGTASRLVMMDGFTVFQVVDQKPADGPGRVVGIGEVHVVCGVLMGSVKFLKADGQFGPPVSFMLERVVC